jgi:hypothetical protein
MRATVQDPMDRRRRYSAGENRSQVGSNAAEQGRGFAPWPPQIIQRPKVQT